MGNQNLHDRLQRASSWINAANTLPSGQKHGEFVFLFIAFNALYGRRQYEGSKTEVATDRDEFIRRVIKMVDFDKRVGQHRLLLALKDCRQEAGKLIVNYFLRDSYWRRELRSKELIQQFKRESRRADERLDQGRWEDMLELILRRLNVLRNQVVHGCVTYGPSSKGFSSLEAGLAVLRKLVPALYQLMDKHGHHLEWPVIPYPRVGSESHPAVDQLH
jgi:hypothetical protein